MRANPATFTISEDDPVQIFDGRQSEAAAALQRGVCRSLRLLGYSVVTELALGNGRRADVVALGRNGEVWIVEIKSCLVDYQTDAKWPDYQPHCDRLYFAVAPDFPRDVIPQQVGLIVADRYGGEFLRDAPEIRLGAARRKSMMLAFARAAAMRLQLHLDPNCGLAS
jgi:hypothetical protein